MGGNNSTYKQEVDKTEEDSQKQIQRIENESLQKEREEIEKERNGKLKYNLTITVYSEEKCPLKYKNYLDSIKMEDWKIRYFDIGFSSKNTESLIKYFKTKSENKKTFDDIIIIIIESYESFINCMDDEDKNILRDFNENLYIEEQPFLLFLNKNKKDFEYYYSSKIEINDKNYIEWEKEFIDYIGEKKEEYNLELIYYIEIDDISQIFSLLKRKKNNKENFNIINDKHEEFIYSSQYCEEVDENIIHESIRNSRHIIVKNLDYNITLSEDFKFLSEISKKGIIKVQAKYYKSNFNKLFNNFLEQYQLLDKRNIYVENYYYSPYNKFLKFCGYYHEFGDFLLKEKFINYPSKINIAICGRAGAGKSTLLNVILGEKRCLEGQGQSVSTYITSYSHNKYPIKFIDFPGFGDKDNAEKLINHIKEKNSQLKEIKEKIHLVIYCANFLGRTFLDKEEDVITELNKLDVKIIFVFTKAEKEESQQFKRFKNTFIRDLIKISNNKNKDDKKKKMKLI